MKIIFVWGLIALLLLSPATAYTLADYPTFFFEDGEFTATIVKGTQREPAEITATNLIINDLPRSGRAYRRGLPLAYYRYRVDPVPATVVVDSDKASFGDEIVIGTPCSNKRVRELLNIPLRLCKTAIQNQGLIQLVEDEFVHIVITGSDSKRVLDSAQILINPRYRLRLRTDKAPIRRITYRTAYQIGNSQAVDIGQTIGAVTPAITSTPTFYQGYQYNANDYRLSTYGTLIGRSNRYRTVPYRPYGTYRELYRGQ